MIQISRIHGMALCYVYLTIFIIYLSHTHTLSAIMVYMYFAADFGLLWYLSVFNTLL